MIIVFAFSFSNTFHSPCLNLIQTWLLTLFLAFSLPKNCVQGFWICTAGKLVIVGGALFLDAQSHGSSRHSQRSWSFFPRLSSVSMSSLLNYCSPVLSVKCLGIGEIKLKKILGSHINIVMTQLLEVAATRHFQPCCPISHCNAAQRIALHPGIFELNHHRLWHRFICEI